MTGREPVTRLGGWIRLPTELEERVWQLHHTEEFARCTLGQTVRVLLAEALAARGYGIEKRSEER